MLECVDIQVDWKSRECELTFADKELNDCLILKMTLTDTQNLWHQIQEATNLTAQNKN